MANCRRNDCREKNICPHINKEKGPYVCPYLGEALFYSPEELEYIRRFLCPR